MSSGPTEEGSIVAKLKVDDSDWNAKLDAAEARARELGAVNPRIKVDAQVDQAITKLEAVSAAEAELGVAQGAQGRSALETALANFELAEATLQAEGAADSAIIAEAELAAANEAATAAIVEETLATEGQVAAQEEANVAVAASPALWQKVVAVVGVVISLMGPLAAVTASGVGGFVGLGVAGVLAVKGIQKQMAEGTTTGRAYSAGIRTLKGDLDQLEDTAAAAFLASFEDAVRQINADMPSLNSEVDQFSGLLGGTATTAVEGIVNLMKVANPLFVDGAEYIQGLADKFKVWTEDGGLETFVQYAERELPIVEDAVNSVTQATVDLADAWTPVGNTFLKTVDAGGKVITLYNDLTHILDKFQIKLSTGSGFWDGFIKGFVNSFNVVGQLDNLLQGLGISTDWLNGLMGEGTDGAKKHKDATEQDSQAQNHMAIALGLTDDAYDKLTASQDKATKSAKDWKAELDLLNGGTQSLEQANIDLAGDYQTMASQITASIKSVGRAQATSLDINTTSGLANHQLILDAIQDAQTQSQAIITAEGGTAKAREDGRLALQKSRQDIIDHLTAAGLDATAVQGIVDAELRIPPHVKSQIEIDTDAAMAKIAAVLKALNQAPPAARTSVGVDISKLPVKGSEFTKGNATGDPYVSGPGSTFSDSIDRRLSLGEAVVPADKNGPFIAAYINNPQAALAGVAASASQGVAGNTSVTIVNKSGASLGDLIDLHIERNGRRQQVDLSTGLQRAAI